MLKIRPDQMQKFNDLSRDRFRGKLVAYLRAELPEQTSSMDDRALLERVIESEERAAKYDVHSEAGVAQWACLTFGLGREFDATPQIQAFLTNAETGMDGEGRLAYLVEYLDAASGAGGAE